MLNIDAVMAPLGYGIGDLGSQVSSINQPIQAKQKYQLTTIYLYGLNTALNKPWGLLGIKVTLVENPLPAGVSQREIA
ncbi:MAG: hypothetical protein OEZ16_01770 [Chromatiales bacterium]|nr:hypothetical protein [Chromatiales bacterium]